MTRIFAFFSFSSLFNNKNITAPIKILFVYFIAFFLSPLLSFGVKVQFNQELFFLLIYQILVGMILGFSIQLVFASIYLTGEIISSQIGLSFSIFFDSNENSQFLVISHFLNIFLFLFFYFFNGHIWIIKVLIKSFNVFPLFHPYISKKMFFSLLYFSNIIFFSGLFLSLPILFFLLIVQMSLAILNKMIPQVSLFSVFFPAILIIGILFLKFFVIFLFPIFFSFFSYVLKYLLFLESKKNFYLY
ncbi:flagellar biosynthetic protein FliR [Buchnera aphidicola]|uniref:flagellar biosynthetic protein FliR n=1 Tax=Buchnera aphidicola TaxID=9 RepID=UPI00094CD953|nr:flagellar biosynthetic protein FliR [Buchnera aphidicola]